MTIKEFCKEYSNRTDKLKSDYLKENLKIITYIPFIKKDVLAQNIVNATTYKFDDYTNEDGTTRRRRTNQIQVNSTAQMILFYRVIIENYTDLEVETEGFYEEYDLLNESGLLDKIMQMIPEKEIAEFNTICDMKKSDLLQNKYENHAFIASQVERFGTLIGITLKPVLEKISEQIENMSDEDVEKFANKFEKLLKRVK